MFPRTGSKTTDCAIPEQLPPGAFQQLIPLKVTRVETLPRTIQMATDNKAFIVDWRERVEAAFPATDKFEDGWGYHYRQGRVHYINACPDRQSMLKLFSTCFSECGVEHVNLGYGLRVMQRGKLANQVLDHFGFTPDKGFLLGQKTLQVSDIGAWEAV